MSNTNNNANKLDEVAVVLIRAADIIEKHSELIDIIFKQLKSQEKFMFALDERYNQSLSSLEKRLDAVEYNSEITTQQCSNIVSAARARVYEILNRDTYDCAKYFRIFVSKLYKDARKHASLGSSISRTYKGDYQRVMNYIDAWYPSCGISQLKYIADTNAAARKKAKNEGYIA